MSIESVDSQTSVGTVNLSRAGFETLLILGEHSAFPERYRLYESTEGLLEDFAESDAEYRAGRKALIQDPAVDQVAIGRRDDSANVAQVDTATVDSSGLADGDVLSLDFEDRTLEVTYDQGGQSADADEAADQVVAAINAEDWPVTAAATATTGELTITSDFPGQPFDATDNQGFSSFTTSTANTPSGETITDALTAIDDVFNDWYALALVSRQDADIAAAADYVAGQRRLFLGRSNDDDVAASATNDVFSDITNLNYDTSAGFYHTRPWYFPDVALLSNRNAMDIDSTSATWDGVELVGVPTENRQDISTTERANLEDKDITYYRDEGGLGETEGGKVLSGEWIDIIVGQHWLNTRLEEKIAALKHEKVNNLTDGKLSFTNEGLTAIEGEIRRQFQDGYENSFLNEERDPDKEINIQRAEDYSSTERDSRVADEITWVHYMAGAIHDAEIRGTLIP